MKVKDQRLLHCSPLYKQPIRSPRYTQQLYFVNSKLVVRREIIAVPVPNISALSVFVCSVYMYDIGNSIFLYK